MVPARGVEPPTFALRRHLGFYAKKGLGITKVRIMEEVIDTNNL